MIASSRDQECCNDDECDSRIMDLMLINPKLNRQVSFATKFARFTSQMLALFTNKNHWFLQAKV